MQPQPHIQRPTLHTLLHALPISLVAAILLQGATALWWTAQQASEIKHQGTRIITLAQTSEASQTHQQSTRDRLARIEERLSAQLALLTEMRTELRNGLGAKHKIERQ